MIVREFKLVNEKGKEYSLMDLNNYCFLSDPAGLGYGYTTEYQQLDNIFITNLRKMNQGQITGIVNFKNYDNYRVLVDFIENSESLKFAYKIPYKTGFKEYFKDIELVELTKTQIQPNRILSETITFNCLSLWYEEETIEYDIEVDDNEIRWDFYWDSEFNDNNSTSIQYENRGHVEAPIKLEILGAVANPKIELNVNGKLCQTVEMSCNIQEYEKLIYDSRENKFEISRIKTDGTEENLFKNNVIDIKNDNVVRLPKGKSCEIKIAADNTIENAKLTIFLQYKCI